MASIKPCIMSFEGYDQLKPMPETTIFSLPQSMTLLLFSTVHHEIDVSIRLLKSNAVGFLFIFLGGLLSRALSAPLGLAATVAATAQTLAVCVMCNYVFDICNQTTSPEEDYYNKPDRPIPSGKITINQARARWAVTWIGGPLILYKAYGVWAMLHLLHWELLITVCYVWPRWFSWFMRNYFASFSYCILGRLLNHVLAGRQPTWNISSKIDFVIFAWFMGTIHVQEFHDVEGDRKSDRKTLPMLLSEKQLKLLRTSTSVFVLLFGLALAFAAYQKTYCGPLLAVLSVLQLASSAVLAYRVQASNCAKMDKTTYHVYYYVPVLMVLLSLVLVVE